MANDQITALASEYAEKEYERLNLPVDCCDPRADDYEQFLRFLLRRFCLVEKNKVEEMYLNAKIAIEKGYDENLGGMMAVGSASKSILESLFPDLGKEME